MIPYLYMVYSLTCQGNFISCGLYLVRFKGDNIYMIGKIHIQMGLELTFNPNMRINLIISNDEE